MKKNKDGSDVFHEQVSGTVIYGISFLITPIVIFPVSSFFYNGPVSAAIFFSVLILAPIIPAVFFYYLIKKIYSNSYRNNTFVFEQKTKKIGNFITRNGAMIFFGVFSFIPIFSGLFLTSSLMINSEKVTGTVIEFVVDDELCDRSDDVLLFCRHNDPVFSYVDQHNNVRYMQGLPFKLYKINDTETLFLTKDGKGFPITFVYTLLFLTSFLFFGFLYVAYNFYRPKFFLKEKSFEV